MNAKKPVSTHVKAFVAGLVMLIFAGAFSWGAPFVKVQCTRADDRVECRLQQRVFGLITFDETLFPDLESVELEFVEGEWRGSTKSTDTYYVTITDADGRSATVVLRSGTNISRESSAHFVDQIETFRTSEDLHMTAWSWSWFEFAPIVPGCLGLLFMGLVAFDCATTQFFGSTPSEELTADESSRETV